VGTHKFLIFVKMHIYLYIKASLQHPGHFFCWRWTCSSETLGASPQPHRPSL